MNRNSVETISGVIDYMRLCKISEEDVRNVMLLLAANKPAEVLSDTASELVGSQFIEPIIKDLEFLFADINVADNPFWEAVYCLEDQASYGENEGRYSLLADAQLISDTVNTRSAIKPEEEVALARVKKKVGELLRFANGFKHTEFPLAKLSESKKNTE